MYSGKRNLLHTAIGASIPMNILHAQKNAYIIDNKIEQCSIVSIFLIFGHVRLKIRDM